MLQDLFKFFSNEVVELHSETADLASDRQLSAEVVHPGLKRIVIIIISLLFNKILERQWCSNNYS